MQSLKGYGLSRQVEASIWQDISSSEVTGKVNKRCKTQTMEIVSLLCVVLIEQILELS
jgi:hypothetical protein